MRDVKSAAAGQPGAREFLRGLMDRQGGSVSFEEFMRVALYHPQFGYYSTRINTVGRRGDFSTSATLHPALGVAIAAWAVNRRKRLSNWAEGHLIELGGGNGAMASGMLRALGWWNRRSLHYHVVERSAPLRREQQIRLAKWPRVHWHEEIKSALAAAHGAANIVSNEFVDAFPCQRLEWDDARGQWREILVAWSDHSQSFVEKLADHVPDSDRGGEAQHGVVPGSVRFAPGQRIETHGAYHAWLQRWMPLWNAGSMLTIDYGDLWPRLYDRRSAGTLRAYRLHQRFTGLEIYEHPGQQDITADVNFTDLQSWGKGLGLKNLPLTTQAEFLRHFLPQKLLRRFERDPACAFLLDEDAAGGAFKVLEQRRGADWPIQ